MCTLKARKYLLNFKVPILILILRNLLLAHTMYLSFPGIKWGDVYCLCGVGAVKLYPESNGLDNCGSGAMHWVLAKVHSGACVLCVHYLRRFGVHSSFLLCTRKGVPSADWAADEP